MKVQKDYVAAAQEMLKQLVVWEKELAVLPTKFDYFKHAKEDCVRLANSPGAILHGVYGMGVQPLDVRANADQIAALVVFHVVKATLAKYSIPMESFDYLDKAIADGDARKGALIRQRFVGADVQKLLDEARPGRWSLASENGLVPLGIS